MNCLVSFICKSYNFFCYRKTMVKSAQCALFPLLSASDSILCPPTLRATFGLPAQSVQTAQVFRLPTQSSPLPRPAPGTSVHFPSAKLSAGPAVNIVGRGGTASAFRIHTLCRPYFSQFGKFSADADPTEKWLQNFLSAP